ncbi:MAG: winged helix-turn-helix transcriptional regulator [Bdellovibrionaceae bacterium]|nr:winged helix-turn-helix transcriptional regulator [Pseudobdellovibrionaceae bacterium]
MAKKRELGQSQKKTIYDLQAEICAALANPVRLQILDLLSEGEKSATDLLDILDIPKANLSQHLAVLKEAGILKYRREGLFQYMSLSIPKIKDACMLVRSVLIEKMAIEEKHNLQLMKELKSQR